MKASDARVFCSSSCAFAEPVAGLAPEDRLTERNTSPRSVQPRHHIKERAHVVRLFLHPHHFARVGMRGKCCGYFRTAAGTAGPETISRCCCPCVCAARPSGRGRLFRWRSESASHPSLRGPAPPAKSAAASDPRSSMKHPGGAACSSA